MKAEWQKISQPPGPPGSFAIWRHAISPVLPAVWPPDGKGLLYYYAYACGFKPGLSGAEVVTTPWARVKVDATGRSALRLEILTQRMKEASIQGVWPLKQEEIAVAKSHDEVERQIFKLSKQTTLNSAGVLSIKRYFDQWCKTNGTIAEQIRPFHTEFFAWVGCH